MRFLGSFILPPSRFLINKTDGTDVTQYDYSSRGELLGVTLPDTTVIEYVHDPLGRRIEKKIDDSITEKYLWQGDPAHWANRAPIMFPVNVRFKDERE